MFIDTHAHLYLKNFEADRQEMIARALENQVNLMFLPNIDSSSIADMYNLVAAFPNNCFAMMGIHPCSIKENYEEELAIAKTELEQQKQLFYAIGEIGLDYYWDTSFKKEQQDALRRQIEWAKELRLPIVLHCRDSFDDTFEIVKEMKDENLSGVFHCFGGTIAEAEKIIALGDFYMGLGGTTTYKKSGDLRTTIDAIDLKHFVLETDAPYLAPEPYRSAKNRKKRRNESAYVVATAQKIADIKNITLETVANVTTQNAETLFKLKSVLQ
ncbi:MAG: TatD family hydrolase [Chitinophagales bacterium]